MRAVGEPELGGRTVPMRAVPGDPDLGAAPTVPPPMRGKPLDTKGDAKIDNDRTEVDAKPDTTQPVESKDIIETVEPIATADTGPVTKKS